MLKITKQTGQRYWRLGEPKPDSEKVYDYFKDDGNAFFGEVVSVEASDSELQFIMDSFDNIPFAPSISQNIWKGEFARFIYDNLWARGEIQ